MNRRGFLQVALAAAGANAVPLAYSAGTTTIPALAGRAMPGTFVIEMREGFVAFDVPGGFFLSSGQPFNGVFSIEYTKECEIIGWRAMQGRELLKSGRFLRGRHMMDGDAFELRVTLAPAGWEGVPL